MAEQVTSPLEPLVAALLGGDPRAAAARFAERGVLVLPHRGGETTFRGREEISAAFATLLSGSANFRYTASRRYITPTQVVEEATLEGRHDGPLAGIPATGEWVRLGARVAATVDGTGEIQRLTVWLDLPSLWAQLGVEESAAAAASAAATSVREESRGGVRVIHGVDRLAAAPAVPPSTVPEERPRYDSPRRRRRGAALLALVGLAAAVGIIVWVVNAVVLPSTQQVAESPATPGSSTPTQAPVTPPPSPSATATAKPSPTLPVITTASPSAKPTVQPGQQVTLSADVLFTLDSADLTRVAQRKLDQLAEQIRTQQVRGRIQVNGYTDDQGTRSHNKQLSEDRALAVTKALQARLGDLAKDVSLMSQGFGENHPVASNATEEGRAKNRRVTVILPTD
jgi:outer membrane protein OmpA-like peptidoglycan-associated protein